MFKVLKADMQLREVFSEYNNGEALPKKFNSLGEAVNLVCFMYEEADQFRIVPYASKKLRDYMKKKQVYGNVSDSYRIDISCEDDSWNTLLTLESVKTLACVK